MSIIERPIEIAPLPPEETDEPTINEIDHGLRSFEQWATCEGEEWKNYHPLHERPAATVRTDYVGGIACKIITFQTIRITRRFLVLHSLASVCRCIRKLPASAALCTIIVIARSLILTLQSELNSLRTKVLITWISFGSWNSRLPRMSAMELVMPVVQQVQQWNA